MTAGLLILVFLAVWGSAVIAAYALGGQSRREAVILALLLSWLGVIIFVIIDAMAPGKPSEARRIAGDPDELAATALAEGTPRSALPMAAQLAYDRLTAQDASR